MRKMWIGLALALLATGCGGTAAVAKGPSTRAAAMSLKEACPLLEQAAPQAMFPSRERLSKFAARLSAIGQAGDLETRQAVELFRKPTDELMTAQPGQESVDASQDWIAAVESIKDRCAAVGSGAFQ
jgi:hypothetical protein